MDQVCRATAVTGTKPGGCGMRPDQGKQLLGPGVLKTHRCMAEPDLTDRPLGPDPVDMPMRAAGASDMPVHSCRNTARTKGAANIVERAGRERHLTKPADIETQRFIQVEAQQVGAGKPVGGLATPAHPSTDLRRHRICWCREFRVPQPRHQRRHAGLRQCAHRQPPSYDRGNPQPVRGTSCALSPALRAGRP